MQWCRVEALDLGNCGALQKLFISVCDVPGITNIALPDSVETFRLMSTRGITSFTCGRACLKVSISYCDDLQTIDMQAAADCDGLHLSFVNLPSLTAISMPHHSLQPPPFIVAQAHAFPPITHRDNEWAIWHNI